MKTRIKIAAAFAVAALFGAGALHAQDASSSASGEPTDEDVLTAAIGCIATYDTVIAQGKAGADAAKIQTARDFAVEVYKEFSHQSDEQVQADIKQADSLLPGMLNDGTTKLDDLRSTCDAVFLEAASSASAPTT